MKKLALTATLVAALGFAPVNTAKAADAADIAGILAGIVALGLIANEIKDRNDERNAPVIDRRHGDGIYLPHARRLEDDRYEHRGRHRRARILPERCIREVDTRRGERLVLGARCLRRNDVALERLPDRCAFPLRTRNGIRDVYGVRCLERQGFVIGDRRAKRR